MRPNYIAAVIGLGQHALVRYLSSASPLIIGVDFTAGPTTGGENNKGCYLSIYGINLGNFADYGTLNHVTIGGVEVDNYRCLVNCVGTGSAGKGNGVYETFGIKVLRVQVGALGSPTAGVALPISVTVGGNLPLNAQSGGNYLDLVAGETITFTPQPGAIIFVDPLNGNNAFAGTIGSPIKDLQISSGFGGALKCASGQGVTDGVKPGTHVILRATATYSNLGLSGSWANMFRVTGTSPTGATDRGPIAVTSYPGAAAANSPETAVFVSAATSGTGGGGFFGNDQARAQEVTGYGITGYCQFMQFSCMSITCAPDGARDAAPFNLASSANHWRISNCEGQWKSTVTGTQHGRAAFAAGNGDGPRVFCNFIHDIWGDTSANENHGIYIDGSLVCANDFACAFNVIRDIKAGNGVQSFNSQAAGSITNVIVHHNWIQDVNKHGLNCADNTGSRIDHDNVVLRCGEAAYRLSSGSGTVSGQAYQCFNNTFYGWGTVLSNRSAMMNDGGPVAPSTLYVHNNIFCQSSSHASNSYSFVTETGTISYGKNRWYDPNGVLTTKPSTDTTGSYGDPLFTSTASQDFTLQSGSPCIDTGDVPVTTRSYGFGLNSAPAGSGHDIGAYER